MQSFKIAFTLFLLLCFLATTTSAANMHEPKPWKEKIISYLNDFEQLEKSNLPEKVLIDFMINEKSELMVISTSDSELDDYIKAKLNYRKIGAKELETLEKYTLPIVFAKH